MQPCILVLKFSRYSSFFSLRDEHISKRCYHELKLWLFGYQYLNLLSIYHGYCVLFILYFSSSGAESWHVPNIYMAIRVREKKQFKTQLLFWNRTAPLFPLGIKWKKKKKQQKHELLILLQFGWKSEVKIYNWIRCYQECFVTSQS